MRFSLFRSPDHIIPFLIYVGSGSLLWWSLKTSGTWQWTVPAALLLHPTRLHLLGLTLFGTGITIMGTVGSAHVPYWLVLILSMATAISGTYTPPPRVPDDITYLKSRGSNPIPYLYAGTYTLSLIMASLSNLHPTWIIAMVSVAFVSAAPLARGHILIPLSVAVIVLVASTASLVS